MLFSRRLQRLLTSRGDPVTSNAADPGVVDTALYRHGCLGLRVAQRALGWLLLKVRGPRLRPQPWTRLPARSLPPSSGMIDTKGPTHLPGGRRHH